MGAIVGRAVRDPSFILIFLGFFSCGYQLGFITAHFPAFVTEVCSPIPANGVLASLGITTTSALGAIAIAVIGLVNIGGTLAAGALGQRYQKKYLLAQIYVARTVVAAAFILAPMTPGSVLLFSALMGVALARHRAADLGPRRADLGPALHGHALRHRLPQPPARRLPRHLARRPALRHLRRLHAGLVDRRRRRRLLGARPPADPRAPGRASRPEPYRPGHRLGSAAATSSSAARRSDRRPVTRPAA